MPEVGHGSHLLQFSHPEVGYLRVYSGADRIAWGYSLNTMRWPTYAGEVVQILSCYIDDIEITGSVQTYSDMEQIYTYFLQYTQIATQGDPQRNKVLTGRSAYNQEPMTLEYFHRGWQFQIMPTQVPGFRKAREQVHPEWRVKAHVVAEDGDADLVSQLVLQEAEIKNAVGGGDDFNENFGLTGQITFLDENPFSDPFTDKGQKFDAQRSKSLTQIADHYSKMLPSYLHGNFEDIFGNIGSQPAFNVNKTKAASAASDTGSDAELKRQYDKIVKAIPQG